MKYTLNIYKKTGSNYEFAGKRIDMTCDKEPSLAAVLKEAVLSLLLNQQFDGLYEANLYNIGSKKYDLKLLLFMSKGKLIAVYKVLCGDKRHLTVEECPLYLGV
ncbi:hypothetical protein [Ruminococcus sp. 5_1_39BFAA]|uniref:hypothetical protein n=1 Tax=Ruminococcus sp. 5_1_39BFAA TaxID=457412 RepID=UPI0035645241